MGTQRAGLWIAMAAAVLAAGCFSREASRATTAPESGTASAATPSTETAGGLGAAPISSVHQGDAISDEEALIIAEALEDAFAEYDADAIAALFDRQAYHQLVVSGLPDDTNSQRDMLAGVARAMEGIDRKLADQLLTATEGGGSYRFLHLRDADDGRRILFRLIPASGGLNYHEVCLARTRRGPRIVDIYVWMQGERMSEITKRMLIAMQPTSTQRLWARALGNHPLQDSMKMLKVIEAFQEKDFQRAVDAYNGLSQSARKNKGMMLMRLLALQQLDETEYAAAIDEYRQAFPGDPSIDLVSLDVYLFREQFSEAHAAIQRLDEAVGGDPYLQVMQGQVHRLKGELDRAEQLLQSYIDADPSEQNVWWLLVDLSLERRDFQKTKELLTRIQDEFSLEFEDLTEIPEYAEFVQSPQYAEWLQQQSR